MDRLLSFSSHYRKSKFVTVKDGYPTPWMNYGIDALRKARVFSMPDVKSGYSKMATDEHNRNKTSFTSYHKLYRLILILLVLRLH